MQKTVLITGCNGGIGKALTAVFKEAGWLVIGSDCAGGEGASAADKFVNADLCLLCDDENARRQFQKAVRAGLGGARLDALINNAAVQHIAGLKELSAEELLGSFKVNAIAPMFLAKLFLDELRAAKGAIVNIGSVHAQATKPGFAAYAASKAGLHGITRGLAVDLGPDIRVNTLAPAATLTLMLKAGFEGKAKEFAELEHMHPAGRLASPEEIARLALFLASTDTAFVTGAVFYADGGILSRLHDPE